MHAGARPRLANMYAVQYAPRRHFNTRLIPRKNPGTTPERGMHIRLVWNPAPKYHRALPDNRRRSSRPQTNVVISLLSVFGSCVSQPSVWMRYKGTSSPSIRHLCTRRGMYVLHHCRAKVIQVFLLARNSIPASLETQVRSDRHLTRALARRPAASAQIGGILSSRHRDTNPVLEDWDNPTTAFRAPVKNDCILPVMILFIPYISAP